MVHETRQPADVHDRAAVRQVPDGDQGERNFRFVSLNISFVSFFFFFCPFLISSTSRPHDPRRLP